jgi:hypothetical protein
VSWAFKGFAVQILSLKNRLKMPLLLRRPKESMKPKIPGETISAGCLLKGDKNMNRFSLLWILRTVAALCALVVCTQASGLDGTSVTPYGLACKAELGAIAVPNLTFNCHDGTVIPIDSDRPCKNPPWLSLGEHGQCVKGARLLKLNTEKADTDAIVICRRYKKKSDPVNNKIYEDVALILHNNTTGKTCFFQALDRKSGRDATNVPSPMADPKNAAEKALAKRAAKFWLPPKKLNDSALRCSLCHDNDVWMHTPYIDQVQDGNAVPQKGMDEWKKDAISYANSYSLVEQEYFVDKQGWPEPNSVLTAKVRDDNGKVQPQVCIDCHRISDNHTKTKWVDWATENPSKIPEQKPGLAWTHYRWMPESPAGEEAKWHKKYDKHIKAMKCCLEHPDYRGCATMPVFGIKVSDKPSWGDAENRTCVDDTGEVAFRAAIDSKVMAARGAKEDSCEAPLNKPATLSFKVKHTKVDGSTETLTKTADKTKTLGHRVPDDPAYESKFEVYPGDRVEISILDTTAWDKDHNLLVFDRWSDADIGGPGNPNKCPCEVPGQTACMFTTRGASDWFGVNPNRPERPELLSDPPNFQCIAQFKKTAECKRPGHGSVPDGKRRVEGLVDCDCEHVDAGLLTGPYIEQCEEAESRLMQLVEQGEFYVTVGADEKIQYGHVCDSTASGPSAWPLSGGPANPPPKVDGPRCRYVGGLVQYECE